MPEIDLFRIFVRLGVPGLAIGIFYMLFKRFKWELPKVPKAWVGPIIVIFMLIVATITLYALTIFAPTKPEGPRLNESRNNSNDKVSNSKSDKPILNINALNDYLIKVSWNNLQSVSNLFLMKCDNNRYYEPIAIKKSEGQENISISQGINSIVIARITNSINGFPNNGIQKNGKEFEVDVIVEKNIFK